MGKAIYKFNKKKAAVKTPTPNPTFVEKPVKGAKNGETRMVRVKRLRNDVPTQEPTKAGTSVNFFSKHKRSLRPSLTPGKICILLAGAHKGKRVCPQTTRLWTRSHQRSIEVERLPH